MLIRDYFSLISDFKFEYWICNMKIALNIFGGVWSSNFGCAITWNIRKGFVAYGCPTLQNCLRYQISVILYKENGGNPRKCFFSWEKLRNSLVTFFSRYQTILHGRQYTQVGYDVYKQQNLKTQLYSNTSRILVQLHGLYFWIL